MELEDQDRRILEVLQKDGQIPNARLAEQVGMSPSACWRRVRALEDAGVIKGYRALVDAARAGLSFHAIVLVQLTRHNGEFLQTFINTITRRPEVLDCFATTGEADYHLRVRCQDLESYNRFLETFLFPLPGVANVRTNLVLKEIKQETALDMGGA